VITVRPDSPFRSLGDIISYAKANPGKLNYPSSGIGTVHHLSGELLNAMAGIDMTHVPFRGGASPLTEALAGRVDLLLEAMTLSIGQVRSGKLRPVAVTSRERWKTLPEVPTVAETVPGYEVISFIGLGATGGTPAPIIQQLNAEVRKVIADPETHKRFVEFGGEPAASSPEEMRSFVEREIAKWRGVMAARNIQKQ
jgi:tripartite-type tricarboxylate transporter receptor subunit TctC